MPDARPALVRSHRRGGRGHTGGWIVFTIVMVLVAGGLTANYLYVANGRCHGRASAVVDASPDIAPILTDLANQWNAGTPRSSGTCVSVTVQAKDSALMATILASDWDPQVNGAAPDVWVPASSVWVREAATSPVVERMIPDRQPSLARTPTVIAMPKEMAAAVGDANEYDWPDLINDAQDAQFWAHHGKPQWGPFRLSMSQPSASTAGLLALMAVADASNDGNVDPAELPNVFTLKQTMHSYLNDTSDVMSGLAAADAKSGAAALAYASAFPALEQDVIEYNRTSPHEPLVALYPRSGTYDADYPYLVLTNPPWAHKASSTVAATAFLTFARSATGRTAFLNAGFRDANRVGGADMSPANGVVRTVTPLPRAVLVPDSVEQVLTDWTAVTRETNMLLVLDISGSMKDKVAGATTRLDLAKSAAAAAVQKFDGQARVGLWVFSTNQDGGRAYREVVPLGALGDMMTDGRTRQQDMVSKIGELNAGGDTGLYDTALAAQSDVADHFLPDATNLVILMTDGKDSTGHSPSTLFTALQRNHESKTPVPIVTIGIGSGADFNTLEQISRLSGTTSLTAKGEVDIDQVLLAGAFGSLPGDQP
jgi:Ca-activated chloride channel family protein